MTNLTLIPDANLEVTAEVSTKKRRGRKPCSGHKLKLEQVLEIRDRYAAKPLTPTSFRKLAAEYGVSYEMIRRIVLQICWKV